MWKANWIISAIIGIIPITTHFLAHLMSEGMYLDMSLVFNPVDICFCGLAMNWTAQTEYYHFKLNAKRNKVFKDTTATLLFLLTIAMIFFLGGIIFLLYFVELHPEIDIINRARWGAVALTITSFFLSYSYVKKINTY